MALFRRRTKTGETNELHVERETWTKRVARVGQALDALQDEARDVVVVTEGDERERGEVVSLLGYRQNTYVAGWTSLMYRLNPEGDSLNFVNERGETPAIKMSPGNHWTSRMRGVGILMDEVSGKLLSPTIVVLPSGVVVNSLVSGFDWPPQYTLRSFAYSNDQIAAANSSDRAAQGPGLNNGVRTS